MLHTSTRSLGRTICGPVPSSVWGSSQPRPAPPAREVTRSRASPRTPGPRPSSSAGASPPFPRRLPSPAVTQERLTDPGQPYVAPTEGTPDLWWNWSPNNAPGPAGLRACLPERRPGHLAGAARERWSDAGHVRYLPDRRREQPVLPPRAGHRGRPRPAVRRADLRDRRGHARDARPAIPGTPAIPARDRGGPPPGGHLPGPGTPSRSTRPASLWSVDNPEVADFPQTRVDTDDCTVPSGHLRGSTQRFQQDSLWTRRRCRRSRGRAHLAGLSAPATAPSTSLGWQPHRLLPCSRSPAPRSGARRADTVRRARPDLTRTRCPRGVRPRTSWRPGLDDELTTPRTAC